MSENQIYYDRIKKEKNILYESAGVRNPQRKEIFWQMVGKKENKTINKRDAMDQITCMFCILIKAYM